MYNYGYTIQANPFKYEFIFLSNYKTQNLGRF